MAEKVIIKEETSSSSSFNFKNYIAGIKKFKWWVLGFTVGCAVVGFIGFKFILNPMRSVFTGTYKYELAGKMEENGSYRLIDGATFDYQDIVSTDVLKAVKESKDEYKNIDVEKIHKSNAITVERILESSKNSKTQEETTVDISYVITAKTNVFPKGEIGKQFVNDLVFYPKQISTEAIEKCSVTSFIDDSLSNESFEKQISEMTNQYNAILSCYKELTSDFGPLTSAGNQGENISSAYNSFLARFSNGAIDTVKLLEGRMYSDCYVNYNIEGKTTEEKDAKVKDLKKLVASLQDSKTSLEKQITIYEDSLTALLNAKVTFEDEKASKEYLAQVNELNEKVVELKQSKEKVEKQIKLYGDGSSTVNPCIINYINGTVTPADPTWKDRNAAFINEVKGVCDALKEETEKATKVYKTVYTLHRNKVSMIESGYISTDKYIPDVIGLVGLAVVGFVITTLVTTGVYISKKDKKED